VEIEAEDTNLFQEFHKNSIFAATIFVVIGTCINF